MTMWKGRVAQTRLALTRLEKNVYARTREEIGAYDEVRGQRNADGAMRTARIFRLGKGPRK